MSNNPPSDVAGTEVINTKSCSSVSQSHLSRRDRTFRNGALQNKRGLCDLKTLTDQDTNSRGSLKQPQLPPGQENIRDMILQEISRLRSLYKEIEHIYEQKQGGHQQHSGTA